MPETMLYFANQLGDGPHVLQVANAPSSSSQNTFSVDYVAVWSQAAITQKAEPKPSTPPLGLIAGAVGGVALLAFLCGVWIFIRRRRMWCYHAEEEPSETGGSVDTSHDAARITPYGPYYQPVQMVETHLSVATSVSQSHIQSDPRLSGLTSSSYSSTGPLIHNDTSSRRLSTSSYHPTSPPSRSSSIAKSYMPRAPSRASASGTFTTDRLAVPGPSHTVWPASEAERVWSPGYR